MILERIQQIEQRVRQSANLTDEAKADLLTQLAELKTEAASVPGAGEPITPGDSSADEQEPIGPIVHALSKSVDGLEASHPRVTELTNRIALLLSNMGI